MISILPQKTTNYFCDNCDFITSNKKDYSRHLATAKHLKMAKGYQKPDILPQKTPHDNGFICCCGRFYKYTSGLWRHKKTCLETASSTNMSVINTCLADKNIILEILQQNQEFKDLLVEQNKKILELSQNATMTQINNNTTTNNNKFNLNVFLNETCKDAMNIMDFANSIEIKMKELEDVGTLGYATGISNIIIRGLNELEIHQRPIHCSDLKRESIHVKDQNIWALDKDKSLMQTAIKRIARKNILKVQDWKQANPEYSDLNSKTMDTYSKILIEATGSFEKEDKERDFGKIVKAIAKEVVIVK